MSMPNTPVFSWSHSRDLKFIRCPRLYYWWFYGSWGGWKPDAPDEARHAFILKHLTTLPLTLGTVIHEVARSCVVAVQQRKPLPSQDEILLRVRAELNRVCISSHHRDQFLRSPTQIPFLQDVYYHGERNEQHVEQVRAKMNACVANLATWPLWDELRALPPDSIRLVEQLDTFQERGVSVFGAPDLVYTPGSPRVVIGDWKTGSEEGAHLQLALYALHLIRAHGFTFEEGAWMGRVMNLATGEDSWHDIRAADLAAAESRIRESIAAMRLYLVDMAENRPMERDAFPLATQEKRHECPRCVFYNLCQDDLRKACGLATHATALDRVG